MKTFKLKIISPNECIFDGEASSVTVTGALGKLTVLFGHAPLITSIIPCDCIISENRVINISGGILHVNNSGALIYSY